MYHKILSCKTMWAKIVESDNKSNHTNHHKKTQSGPKYEKPISWDDLCSFRENLSICNKTLAVFRVSEIKAFSEQCVNIVF